MVADECTRAFRVQNVPSNMIHYMNGNYALSTLAGILYDGPDLGDLVAGVWAGYKWREGHEKFEESRQLQKNLIGQIRYSNDPENHHPDGKDEM